MVAGGLSVALWRRMNRHGRVSQQETRSLRRMRAVMNASRAMAMWASVRVLRRAFREQQAIVREVNTLAAEIVRSPADTPDGFAVGLDPVPGPLLTLRRNLFSSLFQATYHVLEIAPERRRLYGS